MFNYIKMTEINKTQSLPIEKSRDAYILIESSQKFGSTSSEKTPLLGNNNDFKSSKCKIPNFKIKEGELKQCCTLKLIGICMILIGGCAIAGYLMVIETKLPHGFALDLVNREVWSKISSISLGNALNKSNILHILFLQTGGDECMDSESCFELLQNMQEEECKEQQEEIPYNFLIGSDGQTYEIRGWDYESGFDFIPKPSSLVIGFIGNYTFKTPTSEQLISALSLINESKRKQKLGESFQIYGVRNLTISHLDGEALFSQISKWKQFDTLLKVL